MSIGRKLLIALPVCLLVTGLTGFAIEKADEAFPPPLAEADVVSREVDDANGRSCAPSQRRMASGD